MSTLIDIADAVVAELSAGEFSQSFAPERHVLPVRDLADLKDLQVTVVPRGLEISGASRIACQHDAKVDIGVQKKLGADLDAETPVLCGLVEEIADYLRRRPLAGVNNAAWVRTENDPAYAPEHLHEQRTFTSVLTLTYRVMR